jgi:hypothetical protein
MLWDCVQLFTQAYDKDMNQALILSTNTLKLKEVAERKATIYLKFLESFSSKCLSETYIGEKHYC